MQCPECKGEVVKGSSEMYIKCTSCKKIFMNVAGNWQLYPIDDATRQFIEPSLGFQLDPEFAPKKKDAPENCTMCAGHLEKVDKDGATMTRCEKCGLLCNWDGNYLIPIEVRAPGVEGAGWDPEFQAIFEEKLGFTKRVRNHPPGVQG